MAHIVGKINMELGVFKISLFFYGLFNNAVSSLDCIALNDGTINE
jgi:hypothetical protein